MLQLDLLLLLLGVVGRRHDGGSVAEQAYFFADFDPDHGVFILLNQIVSSFWIFSSHLRMHSPFCYYWPFSHLFILLLISRSPVRLHARLALLLVLLHIHEQGVVVVMNRLEELKELV